MQSAPRNVICLLIDAFNPRVFAAARKQGLLPNFDRLLDAGASLRPSISVMPSITHAALSSIITGQLPKQHNIHGLHFYDRELDEVVYYGSDFEYMFREGVSDFLHDFIYRLNHERLREPTFFQELDDRGHAAACINYLIYRGNYAHTFDVPFWVKLWPTLPNEFDIEGPDILYIGDFVQSPLPDGTLLESNGGLLNMYGMKDENAAHYLKQLITSGHQPVFTLVYMAQNDIICHKHGVGDEAVAHMAEIDGYLGDVFAAAGGLAAFLEKNVLLVTGDHAQSDVSAENPIDLINHLKDYKVVEGIHNWQEDSEIMVCPNLRIAQIYLRNKDAELRRRVVEYLQQLDTIDQIIYGIEQGYNARNQQGARLHFWSDENGTPDQRGNRWSWQGDLSVFDAEVKDNTLQFGAYPNAFERITGVAVQPPGEPVIWVTAKLGHEFHMPRMDLHLGGGSHGSLHRDDSETMLLATAQPDGYDFPTPFTLVDVVPLCRALLCL